MLIPFDGYRISLMVWETDEGDPVWQATVLTGLVPCVQCRSHDPLSAISQATILFHEWYLTGRESVRKKYYLGKGDSGKTSQGPSSN